MAKKQKQKVKAKKPSAKKKERKMTQTRGVVSVAGIVEPKPLAMPIKKGLDLPVVKMLLARNAEQSAEYIKSEIPRNIYRNKHRTNIMAFKCMDGRLNLAVMCKLPQGVIKPYRTLGGAFLMGWPYFQRVVIDEVEKAAERARGTIILVTYHWSRSHEHWGCAGFGYDTDKARTSAQKRTEDVEFIFGGRGGVYPILVGMETDRDALVFHSSNGKTLDISEKINGGAIHYDEMEVLSWIKDLYPDMKEEMQNDLLPIIMGNLAHVAEVSATHRGPEELDHAEQVIAIGRGFGWMHLKNTALIVGPYAYDLSKDVGIAASIIQKNIQHKRIRPEDGVALMISSVHKGNSEYLKRAAMLKTRDGLEFAMGVIKEKAPDLLPYLVPLPGIVDLRTQKFEVVDVDSLK